MIFSILKWIRGLIFKDVLTSKEAGRCLAAFLRHPRLLLWLRSLVTSEIIFVKLQKNKITYKVANSKPVGLKKKRGYAYILGNVKYSRRKRINEHHGVCLPVVLCNSNTLLYKHADASCVTICKLDLKWMCYFIAVTSFHFFIATIRATLGFRRY